MLMFSGLLSLTRALKENDSNIKDRYFFKAIDIFMEGEETLLKDLQESLSS